MQTDYSNMAAGVKGGLGTSEFNDLVSARSAEAIPFGRGLVELSTGLVALPGDSAEKFAGVAVQIHKATPNADGVAEYEIGEEITMIRKGQVWVYSEQAVNPTAAVYMRTGDAYQGQNPGDFRVDDDGGSTPLTMLIAGAKWAGVTTAAGLALLELNLP